MNKKLLALLDQINAQKQTVIDLANAGKLEEAKAAKKELQDLQDKFDLLKDIDDQVPTGGDDGSGNEPVSYTHLVLAEEGKAVCAETCKVPVENITLISRREYKANTADDLEDPDVVVEF